ncbi:hypothetical protein E8A74_02200 [Polyangium fumosum]|uniref:Uncharacterized protein n=1 Tax=Polyangium fumosum TaxID=889272 RepID=A0A4U1JLP2_9BACT|nr:hypothetical protein E8A74_02200 [Polyangium fumosum]
MPWRSSGPRRRTWRRPPRRHTSKRPHPSDKPRPRKSRRRSRCGLWRLSPRTNRRRLRPRSRIHRW